MVLQHDLVLPADGTAPAMARATLDQLASPVLLGGRADDARLAVTELATNAVRHGRLREDPAVLRLMIDVDDDRLRVEIEQPGAASGARIVKPRQDDLETLGGYGLRLVDEVVDDWGHDPGPPSIVWFEFRR